MCKLMGAHMQASFSFKEVPANRVKRNTHLVAKKAAGPKYTAAKSWNLPAVSLDWVIECCVAGMKADESKFAIENYQSSSDLIEALGRIRRNEENLTNSKMNSSTNSVAKVDHNSSSLMMARMHMNFNESVVDDKNASVAGNKSRLLDANQDDQDQENNNHNDSSLSIHNVSKKPRMEVDDHEENKGNRLYLLFLRKVRL